MIWINFSAMLTLLLLASPSTAARNKEQEVAPVSRDDLKVIVDLYGGKGLAEFESWSSDGVPRGRTRPEIVHEEGEGNPPNYDQGESGRKDAPPNVGNGGRNVPSELLESSRVRGGKVDAVKEHPSSKEEIEKQVDGTSEVTDGRVLYVPKPVHYYYYGYPHEHQSAPKTSHVRGKKSGDDDHVMPMQGSRRDGAGGGGRLFYKAGEEGGIGYPPQEYPYDPSSLEELEARFSKLATQFQVVLDKNVVLENRNAVLEARNAQIVGRFDAFESTVDFLESQMKVVASKCKDGEAQLRTDVEGIKTSIEGLATQLTTDLDELDGHVEVFKNASNAKQTKLMDKVEGLEDDATQLRTDLDELDGHVEGFKDASNAKQTKLMDQVEGLEDNATQLRTDLDELDEHVEDFKNASNAKQTKLMDQVEGLCMGACVTPSTRNGLKDAIKGTGEGGTLTLCAPTTIQWDPTDFPLTKDDVPASFTLQCDPCAAESDPCILDARGLGSNFFTSINPPELSIWTFRGMTFQGGKSRNIFGGAIAFSGSGSVLTLEACHFLNNTADVGGGALDIVQGARLEATSCQFKGNVAGAGGGAVAIENKSSADFSGGGNVFDGNSARLNGGALFVNGDSTVTLCTASPALDNKFVDNVGDSILQDYCNLDSSINVPSTDDCEECVEIKDTVCDKVVPCQSR